MCMLGLNHHFIRNDNSRKRKSNDFNSDDKLFPLKLKLLSFNILSLERFSSARDILRCECVSSRNQSYVLENVTKFSQYCIFLAVEMGHLP